MQNVKTKYPNTPSPQLPHSLLLILIMLLLTLPSSSNAWNVLPLTLCWSGVLFWRNALCHSLPTM